MDAYLAVASRRDRREYDGRPLAPETQERILDAGRLSGSAMNKQPWRFLVVESRERVEQLAGAVYAEGNVLGAGFVVAIAIAEGTWPVFDAGRAAQNMMLAAWNEGVDSCPNGIADAEAARSALGLDGEEIVLAVLSFGYPRRPRAAEGRSTEDWSAEANRKPLDELVVRL